MRKGVRASATMAGLTGAGGLILAAADAHLVPDTRLHTAASLMLLHAVAAIALTSLALAVPQRGIWFVSAAGMLLSGSVIFGCDLTLRALLATRLFPMAAPLGGSLLILGWIIIALAAVVILRPSHSGTGDQIIDK
jgi:uncharacterized membrane protein YgdD (TMEM256/DUF423 family)